MTVCQLGRVTFVLMWLPVGLSFGGCHFCVGVAAGWCDSLSFGLCHFCVDVTAGWWVTVCHLGRVTFVLMWLPVGG